MSDEPSVPHIDFKSAKAFVCNRPPHLVSSIESFGGTSFSVVAGVRLASSGELWLCPQAMCSLRVNWGTHHPVLRARVSGVFCFSPSPLHPMGANC